MPVRAIRGATRLTADDPSEMTEAVVELVEAMLERNDLDREALVSVIFTATPDLVCMFPAAAARGAGLGDVPLICAQEIAVPGALSPSRARAGPCRGRPSEVADHACLPPRRRGAAPGPRAVTVPAVESVLIVGSGLIGASIGLGTARTRGGRVARRFAIRRRSASPSSGARGSRGSRNASRTS